MHKNWMQNNDKNESQLKELWNLSKDYKRDYEPDVNKGITKLKARIAKDENVNSPLKVVAKGNKQWLRRIAAVGLFLVAFGFLFNLFFSEGMVQQVVSTNTSKENIELPDGTKVWVNKHSKLSYPKSFSESTRIVELEGEAFFEVAKNPSQPFLVKTLDSEIRVLGTAFNVRAYKKEGTTVIDVEEGKVGVEIPESNQEQILNANDQIIFTKETGDLSKIKELDWKATAWRAKQLNFKDQPISEVLTYLEENFEVKVDADKNIIDCSLNASLVKNNPEAILKRLNSAFSLLEIKKVDAKYYQLNGNCN